MHANSFTRSGYAVQTEEIDFCPLKITKSCALEFQRTMEFLCRE